MVKLLHLYDETTNIEKALELFDIMKRFRVLSLQKINATKYIQDNHDNFLLRFWNTEIFNIHTLPIFMKIIYDYFYSLAINDENIYNEISESMLFEYKAKAEEICKYINYNINTPISSLHLCAIEYLMGHHNIANTLSMNIIEKYFDTPNDECLLTQWPNGQFVLNLSKSLHIPHLMNIPLMLTSLIFYAKTIPKQNKSIKSIKIRIDIQKLDEMQRLFEYLAVHYPPKIEYEMIGKISNWLIVIELELNSLLKWCEYHNVICFQDVDKQHILTQTCADLLPELPNINKMNKINTINVQKQIFKDLNNTIYK